MIRFVLLLFFAQLAWAAEPNAVTPDGGRYYGPLVNGKLHGTGRIEWDSGGVYEGSFVNGVMSGRGKLKMPNGSYEGEFRNGLPSGRGRMTYANGMVYEGEFSNSMPSGKGKAKYPNGGTYEGTFQEGGMSGRGRLEIPGREIYEGDFKLDNYWGQGEVRYPDGRSYRGDFVRGEYEGKGRFTAPNGEVYEGEFHKSEFTGNGKLTRKDGSHYEGGFKNWRLEGPGRYTDAAGNVWEGTFKDGQIAGKGKHTSRIGVYEGEFRDWLYHGQGTLTYAKPKPDGRKQDSGTWRFGSLQGARDDTKVAANVESALYAQKDLLQKALGALQPREPGRINLWLVAVAGDGKQEVFRREVEFVQKEFAQRFGTAGRTVALVNSRNTVTAAPMATVTSLRDTLKAVAARMDREQDILFLFLTSHGSREHEFILSQSGMDLPDLPAKTLGAMLRESGIRWKVVVVSACYSGGFIPPLRGERTLVITAARSDRTSFGCADENDFTYFGRAYFKEALPKAGSFQHAFSQAEILVKDWEMKDNPRDEQSMPQMSVGSEIEAHLKKWWGQASR